MKVSTAIGERGDELVEEKEVTLLSEKNLAIVMMVRSRLEWLDVYPILPCDKGPPQLDG